MGRLVDVVNVIPWFALVSFLFWAITRHNKASRLEKENKLLRVLKHVEDKEEDRRNLTVDELVAEINSGPSDKSEKR